MTRGFWSIHSATSALIIHPPAIDAVASPSLMYGFMKGSAVNPAVKTCVPAPRKRA